MMAPAEVYFSAKHNGLYLYFSRLVRPIWLATLVVPGPKSSDPKQPPQLASSVRGDEIDWIMTQLNDLTAFMERNAQFTANTNNQQAQELHQHHLSNPHMHHPSHMQQQNKSQQEALLRERQSLLFLQQLVGHCLQVLGLWKVVLDDQFHIVISSGLSLEDINVLRGMYFRDLIISAHGKELCSKLVQAVINRYLGDNANTDAISHRLRQLCPSLYNNEDAISSKAHEILIAARSQNNPREKDRMLTDAVNMCKHIASSRLNLDVLTSHLMAVHCYKGVVEISLAAANKRDPQNLALHYYKNGESIDDHQGFQSFVTRMACYKHILEMQRRLLETSASAPHSSSSALPKSPGPPPPPDPNQLEPAKASQYAEDVFQAGLSSEDQLFHVALYQWLTDQGQYDRLLNIRSSFLEDFLTRGTKKQPESIVMFDLLWKFYEKTRSYTAAAKILSKLADRHRYGR